LYFDLTTQIRMLFRWKEH